MAEHIVELDTQLSFKMPTALVEQLDLTPGDNLILRMNDGVLEIEKLAMTATKNGEKLHETINRTISITEE